MWKAALTQNPATTVKQWISGSNHSRHDESVAMHSFSNNQSGTSRTHRAGRASRAMQQSEIFTGGFGDMITPTKSQRSVTIRAPGDPLDEEDIGDQKGGLHDGITGRSYDSRPHWRPREDDDGKPLPTVVESEGDYDAQTISPRRDEKPLPLQLNFVDQTRERPAFGRHGSEREVESATVSVTTSPDHRSSIIILDPIRSPGAAPPLYTRQLSHSRSQHSLSHAHSSP